MKGKKTISRETQKIWFCAFLARIMAKAKISYYKVKDFLVTHKIQLLASLSLSPRPRRAEKCVREPFTYDPELAGKRFFGLQPVCRDILPRPAIELFSSSASCCYFLIIFGNEAGSHGEKLTVSASLARFVCFATQL
jgi:hypothetical protein